MIASNFRTYDHEALLGLLGSQDTVSQDTLNLSNVSNISTMSSLSKLSTVMQSHARDTVSQDTLKILFLNIFSRCMPHSW
jgi:hypothetical protein